MNTNFLSVKLFTLINLIFAAFLCFLFKDFIFDASQLLLANDQINAAGVRYLREGHIIVPQWNPYVLGGMPTLDALFGDALHPLVLLEKVTSPERGVSWKFIFCLQIAFASALSLGQYLTKNWKAASILAALFAISPQFASLIYPGHDGKMMVIAVLPLMLLGLYLWMREGKFLGLFLTATSVAWMLLSSHVQMTYFSLIGLGLVSLGEVFWLQKEQLLKHKLIKKLGITLAVFIGLGIGSIQLLPAYLYTTESSVRASSEKTSMGHAASWSAHPEELMSFILPDFIGNISTPEGPNYWGANSFKLNHDSAGIALLVLALLSLGIQGKSKEKLLWIYIGTFWLVYSMTAHTPFFKLFYEFLPGVKNFRAASMVLFWIPMAFFMLSSYTLKSYFDGEFKVKASHFISIALLVIYSFVLRKFWPELGTLGFALISLSLMFVALTLRSIHQSKDELSLNSFQTHITGFFPSLSKSDKVLWAIPFLPFLLTKPSSGLALEFSQYVRALNSELADKTFSSSFFSAVVVLVVIGGLYWALNQPSKSKGLLIAIGVLAIIEINFLLSPFIQLVPRDRVLPDSQIADYISQQDPEMDYRTLILDNSITPNNAPYYGIRMATGFHDNEIQSYFQYKGERGLNNYLQSLRRGAINNNPYLNIAGIKYIIAPGQPKPKFFANDSAFARASLYTHWQQTEGEKLSKELLKVDYQKTALIEGIIPKSTQVPSVKKDLKLTVIQADQYEVEVPQNSSGLILFNENYQKFWKAEVNGQELQTVSTFGTFLGVEIPQDLTQSQKATVKIWYESDSFNFAMNFFYLGVFGLIVLAGLAFTRDRKSPIA